MTRVVLAIVLLAACGSDPKPEPTARKPPRDKVQEIVVEPTTPKKHSRHDHSHLHPHDSGGHHHHPHPHPHMAGDGNHHHPY
jgi:hypothetical protein